MEKVITIIAALAAIAFLVGLINPKFVLMPNRKRSSAIFAAVCIAAGVVGSILYPTHKTEQAHTKQESTPQKSYEYSTKTLNDWLINPQKIREDWIESYIEYADLAKKSADDFYNCISEYSHTKSDGLQLGLVLGWCKSDYDSDATSLSNRINFDVFESQFSVWDGSYRPLVELVKAAMNNPKSFEHVSTKYSLLLNGSASAKPHATVFMVYRGTNGFGAIVKASARADVDIKTGQIIKILN